MLPNLPLDGSYWLGKVFSIAAVWCQARFSLMCSLPKNNAVSQGSRFSSRSALWPPHDGFRRMRWNNLNTVLPKRNHVPCELTSSIVPAGRFSAGAELNILLHAATASASLRQRNWVPSIHIRCRMTARRRARATIAFLPPRRRASCMPQALSQDHFWVRVTRRTPGWWPQQHQRASSVGAQSDRIVFAESRDEDPSC